MVSVFESSPLGCLFGSGRSWLKAKKSVDERRDLLGDADFLHELVYRNHSPRCDDQEFLERLFDFFIFWHKERLDGESSSK